MPESFKQAIRINKSLEVQDIQAKINQLDSDDPEYFNLVVEDPGYTQRIDLALADLFDINRDYWFIGNNLADKVYSDIEELKSAGARILYFKPPNYYSMLKHKIDFSKDIYDEYEMPF